jgi:hypothetical protein
LDHDAPPVAITAPLEEPSTRIKIPVFVPSGSRCPPHEPGEIVVCAEDPEKFRLRPPPDKLAEPIPRPRLKMSEGTSIGAELEGVGIGGQVSNRVMVRAKIKF